MFPTVSLSYNKMLTSKGLCQKKGDIINARKMEALFTQQSVFSVQDIQCLLICFSSFHFVTSHTSWLKHPGHTQISKEKNKLFFFFFLSTTRRADRGVGFWVETSPFLFLSPPSSHEVIELGLQGGGHLVRLRAAALLLLVGVLGRFVRRLRTFRAFRLTLLRLVVGVFVLFRLVVLPFVAP